MSTQSLLTKIPENKSFVQANKFTFAFPTLPFLKYYCQTVNLPAIGTNAVQVNSPFAPMYRHGDTLAFDQLNVSVIVDEDLRVWEETYKWLVSLTKPTEFPEYVRFNDKQASPYHDAVLTFNTNANIPNLRFKFFHCHPVSISTLQLSVMETADTMVTLDIGFRYDTFEIERLTFG